MCSEGFIHLVSRHHTKNCKHPNVWRQLESLNKPSQQFTLQWHHSQYQWFYAWNYSASTVGLKLELLSFRFYNEICGFRPTLIRPSKVASAEVNVFDRFPICSWSKTFMLSSFNYICIILQRFRQFCNEKDDDKRSSNSITSSGIRCSHS